MSSREISEFFSAFQPGGEDVHSVPLKGPRFATTSMVAHSSRRRPTPRSIAALAAAAAGSGCKLVEGELVPRRLSEPAAVVENGATSDILRAGLATADVTPEGAQAFRLTSLGVGSIRSSVPSETIDRFFR
jgi:hypothetical protein